MPQSRRSSKPRTLRTESGENFDSAGFQDLDEAEAAMSVETVTDECPSCYRGRIINSRCNRCGVAVPTAGTLRDYAWRSDREDNET